MDIEQTISELTLEEKVRLLAGASMWTTEAVDRLDIPSIILTDGPHGVRLDDFQTGETSPATAFPVESAMAATWNEDLIFRAGLAMAEECRHYNVAVLLGPGVNGKRSPLGGRNFEYYSEDPFLNGRMGTAFVKGVQSGGVGTSLKHFVANEQEKNRMVVSSEVDERALREIYLRPFETVVKEAQPWTVMCSYNKVNGERMSHNDRYLNGVLKGEWGFDGVVVSDWGAVYDKVASVANGLDLEMPGPGRRNQQVLNAYEAGIITDEELNDRVRRLLKLVDRAVAGRRNAPEIDLDAHHALAASVAEESLVLLRNEEGLLPLDAGEKIAVVGELAETPRFQGGGSSHMNPARLDIPRDAIAEHARVIYEPGYKGEHTDDELVARAVTAAEQADAVVVFVGTTDRIESEGYDRRDLSLPDAHLRLVAAVVAANPRTVVVNHSGSVVDLSPADQVARALLHAWLPGQAGGRAIARTLFGLNNPCGKLTETFPEALEHNPSYLSFPGTAEHVHYREGIFVGYRHYDTRKLPVRYPFGFGLSFTSFRYANLKLSRTKLTNGDTLTITVDVENTGDVPGKEIVQLYVRDPEAVAPRPLRELKGFAKAELAPAETKSVSFRLDESAFAYWVDHLSRFAVESGEFVVEIGASSRDIRLSRSITFASGDEVRPPLTMNNDLGDYLTDDRYASRVKPAWEKLVESAGGHALLDVAMGMPIYLVTTFLPAFGASEESVAELRDAIEGRQQGE